MSVTEKYKDLSKNTLLFAISNFGSKFISFFLVPLYTYTLSKSDYGTLDLVNTTVSLLIPILTLNIQDAVLRFSLDQNYDKTKVISVGIKISLITTLLLTSSVAILKYYIKLPLADLYLYYLLLSYAIGTFQNILSMYLRAKNEIKCITICSILNSFISCILNLLLLLYYKLGIIGFLIANTLGHIFSIIYMYLQGKVYKDFSINSSPQLTKEMIAYSSPLTLNTLSWWINNASDRYILTSFCGVTINGIYAVSYKIPSILTVFQTIFYNAWSISAIKEFNKEDSDGFIGKMYSYYSCISFVGCSLLMLINQYLAKFLFSNDFFEAWLYVPPLLVGNVFNGISLFEGCLFTAVRQTKEVSVTTIFGAITNTILNLTLIPYLGAMGAAIATMIGYLTIWSVRTIKLGRIISMKVSWKQQIMLIILLMIQCIFAISQDLYWYQLPITITVILINYNYIKSISRFGFTKLHNILTVK